MNPNETLPEAPGPLEEQGLEADPDVFLTSAEEAEVFAIFTLAKRLGVYKELRRFAWGYVRGAEAE